MSKRAPRKPQSASNQPALPVATTRLPDEPGDPNIRVEAIKAEIEARFGFFPPFFSPALRNAQVLENLWQQTLSAYVDNPLPARFKEKLNAYLSRFCGAPYCMVCHSCVLRPLGMSAQDVLGLLETPPPTETEITTHLQHLMAQLPLASEWLHFAELEDSLIRCSIPLFTNGEHAHPYRIALQRCLGPEYYQHLVIYLAYIQTCHTWMEAHPEISYLDDQRVKDNLAPLLAEAPGLATFLNTYQERVRYETQQKVAAQATAVERARGALEVQAREARYQALVQATSQAIWTADQFGNRSGDFAWWAELTGQSPADAAGAGWLNSIHPDDQEAVRAAWAQARETLTVLNITYRIRTRQGDYRNYAVRGVPITDPHGNLREWIGTFNDITERKQIEEERARLLADEQAARAAAQEAVRVRDAFLSIASHELKNPLTALRGTAQLLQRRAAREGALNDTGRHALGVIIEQAQRMDEMLSALLDVSRMEHGQLTITRAPLDVIALLRQVLEELQPTLDRHTLSWDFGTGPVLIAGDKLRLAQVFQNLLHNAVKYSPGGGAVTVQITQDAAQVCIVVRDQGIGIPPAALPQLFQRFYRAENAETRQISGTGIGLYVVKEVIALHGGSVAAASDEGQGSHFTVCLPRLAEKALPWPAPGAE